MAASTALCAPPTSLTAKPFLFPLPSSSFSSHRNSVVPLHVIGRKWCPLSLKLRPRSVSACVSSSSTEPTPPPSSRSGKKLYVSGQPLHSLFLHITREECLKLGFFGDGCLPLYFPWLLILSGVWCLMEASVLSKDYIVDWSHLGNNHENHCFVRVEVWSFWWIVCFLAQRE